MIDYQKYASMYASGMTNEELAKIAGINKVSMFRGLKKLGVQMRPQGTKSLFLEYAPREQREHPAHYESIAKTYEQGNSLSQAAAICNVTIGVVRGALAACNVVLRDRGTKFRKTVDQPSRKGIPLEAKRTFDYDLMASLYTSGASLNELALRFYVDVETVRSALKRMGVPRRQRGASAGELNHQFKGGECERYDGYVVQRGTRAKKLMHRVIAVKALGRELLPGEVVHHINCNRSDNRPENLLVCTQKYHMQLHARMRKHPYWKQFSK